MTFLELKQAVERNLIDTPTAIQSAVGSLVNSAVKKLQRKRNFHVMQTVGSYTTDAGAGDLGRVLTAQPSDFKEFRGPPWYETELGQAYPMTIERDPSSVRRWFSIDDDGEPAFIFPTSETDTGVADWELYPLPDNNSDYSDGEYRIFVPYWRYLPALSADADTNWFTVNAEEWIEFKATSDGFYINEDEARAQVWLQRAELEWRDVKNADAQRWMGGVDSLIPHTGARGPFMNM